LSAAIDRIYYAISNSPELPHDDHPWEVSISRPDGIPYALTKLFRLQELLRERFRLNPEETAALQPGCSVTRTEKELLDGAAADLETVIHHWPEPQLVRTAPPRHQPSEKEEPAQL